MKQAFTSLIGSLPGLRDRTMRLIADGDRTIRQAVEELRRNLVQARSERRPREATTATRLGVADHAWGWEDVLARRLQPSLVRRRAGVMTFYRRDLVTPQLTVESRHRLVRAF